ncbi:outer membrane protein [Roseovarius sp.]|uniref:outer membrane protein n=1 Tax=Roseovarius sp. TaxID=1486281 RepID=UPI003A97295B
MRVPLPIFATTALALATPALAQSTVDAARFPNLPAATGYDPSPAHSFDNAPTVSRGAGSVFSSQGTAIGRNVNWTGFYIGGQLGVAFGDSDTSGNDETAIGGITAGYDYDFGRWVLGGALDYDFTDFDIAPASSLEEIFRVKVRGGPKIGRGLLYGAGGYAYADTDNLGDDDGWFLGAGYEYLVNDQFSVGGEVLYHEFDNFNSTGNDVEATTVQIRATFRF